MKRKFALSITLFLVSILTITACSNKDDEKKTTEGITVTDSLSDYTDSKGDFKMKYPTDWRNYSDDLTKTTVFQAKGDVVSDSYQEVISVRISTLQESSLGDEVPSLVNELKAEYLADATDVKSDKTKIDDTDAFTSTFKPTIKVNNNDLNLRVERIWVAKESKLFTITFTVEDSKSGNYDSIWKQVKESFEIL